MKMKDLQQAFSSDPSAQSMLSSQNSFLSIHWRLPQASWSSGQMGSSVLKRGRTLRGSNFKQINELIK